MKIIIGACAVGLAGLSACGRHQPATGRVAEPPVAVSVATVTASDNVERLEAGGVVAAPQSATLSSRIVAAILSVRGKAGDRVRAGDVLVRLEARDVAEGANQARAGAVAAEMSLARARSERRAAEAEHRLAAAWQERIATLHARKSATDQERDEADARLAAAAARLAGAQAGIDGGEAQLLAARGAVGAAVAVESFATIRAPFDGLITERLVDPGNLAAPGVPLLRVEAEGARQVVVRLDEARAAYLQPGDRVRVVIGVGDADEDGVDGVVDEIARAVAADQRAFTVKVTLPTSVSARSGSFARVLFRGAPRRAVFVPAQAVHRHGQVSSVYVIQDGVARLRLIQAGPASPAGVEVLAGLEVDESIVVAPPRQLSDGAEVVIGSAGAGGPS